MTFADGACEARSRSKEKVMQGHRRRRATQRSPATSISPKGGGGTASISLSLLLHDVTDIASSSLRELDAVALTTNVTISMKRGTERTAGSTFAGAWGTRLRVPRLVSAPISTASLRSGVRKLGSFSFAAYDELYVTEISYRDDDHGLQWGFSLVSGF